MNHARAFRIAKELMGAESVALISEDATTARQSLFGVQLGDGRVVVMKCYESAELFDAELEGLRIATEYALVPCPKVILANRSYLVTFFEKLEGKNWTQILTQESVETQCQIAEEIGRVLRRIHSVREIDKCSLRAEPLEHLLLTEFGRLSTTIMAVRSSPARTIDGRDETLEVLSVLLSKLRIFVNRKPPEAGNQRNLLVPTVLHGDLWSGNIFISGETPRLSAILLDYEFAMLGSRMIDLVRIFSRGFHPRDATQDYYLEPNKLLWDHFADGYRLRNKNIQDSQYFHHSLFFSLVRTINYYGVLIGEQQGSPDRVTRHLKTMRRISDATVAALQTQTS